MATPAFLTIGPLTLLLVLGCFSDSKDQRSIEPNVMHGSVVLADKWEAFTPNSHQIILVEHSSRSPEIANHLFFIDLGEGVLLDKAVLPGMFRTAELDESGVKIQLRVEGPIEFWEFSIEAEVKSGLSESGKMIMTAAIGISEMRDENGWDLKIMREAGHKEAAGMIGSSRVKDPVREPETVCTSGGPGSSNCSGSSGGWSCSVGCTAGYYACCGAVHCFCVKN